MDILEVTSLYENTLKVGNKSSNTLRSYMKDVKKLVNRFSLKSTDDILKLTVSDYLSFYNEQNFEKQTSLNGLIRNLSAFFSFFSNLLQIEENEISFFQVRFGNSKFVKEVQEEVEVLTNQEIRDLVLASRNIQEKAMLVMMAYQGFRAGTIVAIKMEDLNLETGEVKIYLKGNKKVFVALHNDVIEILKRYVEERDSNEKYLFYAERGRETLSGSLTPATVNNRVKSAATRAGFSKERIEKVHAHGFRHYFGSKMVIEHGLDVAQRALNHANSSTTKRYDHTGTHVQSHAIVNQKSIMLSEN